MKLVLAQGNPGKSYGKTKHNVGFNVLDVMVKKIGLEWKLKAKFDAELAEMSVDGEKIIFAKPTTFYNETGVSARKLVDFYSLDVASSVLVVHDDLALPFGTIRVRAKGTDAGNNGIKSLNTHIGPDYHRVRIGIWNDMRERMGDSDFVLAKFSKDEEEKLQKEITPHVIEVIDKFCNKEIQITSKSFSNN